MAGDTLRFSDAVTPVDVKCDHVWWHTLNQRFGCIHASHGGYPFALADPHTGLRLVDGVPTRYIAGKAGAA